MSGFAREVLKWIQSLDLTYSVKNPRRDFSNGYLVAEIFSWYFPQDIQMHSYVNGTSIERKLGNWQQLERFIQKYQFPIPKDFIEGTIHCKPNAAVSLVELLYTLLTNRHVRRLDQGVGEFTDSSYQSQLPMYARSTASQAIKNNIALTELTTQPDRIVCTQKAKAIVHGHAEHRRQERHEDPERFGLRKVKSKRNTVETIKDESAAAAAAATKTKGNPAVSYREVDVNQPSQIATES
ncbi:spermatogenesis-associated protein 4-like [Oscarella lobularis]|uniref:spermatogenesis-associated protein 4-like n=1 Tax=Oscarella lobularis TaxID=121494 RepID=UPI0033144CB1